MSAEQILKEHGVKKTVCRKCIIDKLIENENTALTENEIKDAFLGFFDQVTCLDSSLLDRNIHFPSNYQVESIQMLLEGICPDCRTISR